MIGQEVITIAGVVIAALGVLITIIYRTLRDRHKNFNDEWAAIQSLADEMRMNWELIRLGSTRILYDAWLAVVRERRWIHVESKDYYDLLSLYSLLVWLNDATGQRSTNVVQPAFRDVEPWVAAWWAHLQSVAEQWRDWLNRKRSWVSYSRRPAITKGPHYWEARLLPRTTDQVWPSNEADDVKDVVKGNPTITEPWALSIRSQMPKNSQRQLR